MKIPMKNADRSRSAKALLTLAVSAVLLASASPARAHDIGYPADGDHPLRIAHYFLYPVGKFLEVTVTRPMSRVGHHVSPYRYIDSRGFSGCSRERPARSCSEVVK